MQNRNCSHENLLMHLYVSITSGADRDQRQTTTQGRAVFNRRKSTLEAWVWLDPSHGLVLVSSSVCISTHCGNSTLHSSKSLNYVVSCLQRTALQNCCKHLVRRAASILGSDCPVLTFWTVYQWLPLHEKDSVVSLNCHRLLKGLYCPNIT